ncbi:MAG TPA: hypothetical protein VES42_22710 [Pilimelia sp.]|nr:hypothetical protein [Pilimelia sp.]
MPDWVPTTIILLYAGIITLLALAGVFSETVGRRDAAYKVLCTMLPWGVLAMAAQAAADHFAAGA